MSGPNKITLTYSIINIYIIIYNAFTARLSITTLGDIISSNIISIMRFVNLIANADYYVYSRVEVIVICNWL